MSRVYKIGNDIYVHSSGTATNSPIPCASTGTPFNTPSPCYGPSQQATPVEVVSNSWLPLFAYKVRDKLLARICQSIEYLRLEPDVHTRAGIISQFSSGVMFPGKSVMVPTTCTTFPAPLTRTTSNLSHSTDANQTRPKAHLDPKAGLPTGDPSRQIHLRVCPRPRQKAQALCSKRYTSGLHLRFQKSPADAQQQAWLPLKSN